MSFLRRIPKIRRAAVLGCGPAGLFAVHALAQNGWDVTIFSKKRRSDMFGAQYLHAPIPGLTDGTEPVTVAYRLRGTVKEYREKVYGRQAVVTSVEALAEKHQAWDIRGAYRTAYDLYGHRIQDQEVTPEFLGISQWSPDVDPIGPRSLMLSGFDYVLNSIPADRICYQPDRHRFHSTTVWAMGDAPDRGSWAPSVVPDDNTVICDGTGDTGWYRASKVYGHTTVEWPGRTKPPMPGVAEVVKPIGTDCNCYRQGLPYGYIPIGRYGIWSKGVLSHHAYTQAAQL